MKLFLLNNLNVPNYIEPTSNNSFGSWFYITKEETRQEGPWSDNDEDAYFPEHLEILKSNPYPFQQQIIDSANIKDDMRTVNVIYDPYGCSGKTCVALYLSVTSKAILVPMCKTSQDIIQFVCSFCMPKKLRNPSPIFIDLPRALHKHALEEIYSGIEILKSGALYDTRFTARRWM